MSSSCLKLKKQQQLKQPQNHIQKRFSNKKTKKTEMQQKKKKLLCNQLAIDSNVILFLKKKIIFLKFLYFQFNLNESTTPHPKQSFFLRFIPKLIVVEISTMPALNFHFQK